MTSCLDPELLQAFVEQRLTPEERLGVEVHIDACPACRELLAVAASGWLDPSSSSLDTLSASDTRPDRPLQLAPRRLEVTARDAPGTHGWLLQAQEEVDKYRVMRPLGRGGMGEVYLARDSRLGRRVALKFITASAGQDVDRFILEGRATAQFNHPNIITLYDVGEHRGCPYAALEFVEGQTLAEKLREGPLAVGEVLRFGAALAGALAEAHRQSILHRDLKPSNIMIASDGRLRILDFGLAHFMRGAEVTAVTSAGPLAPVASLPGRALAGTPAYMAPEQWLGLAPRPATDLFALGLVLYEMLVGRKLYGDSLEEGLRDAITSPEPPSLDGLADVPAALTDVIAHCLAKPPEGRPTAEEVARDLRALLDRGARLEGDESPFRGLLPFGEQHARTFCGRDQEVTAFVDQLRQRVVLPVVGPSGAGKSSFVRAGVIPRLREQRPWHVLRVRPAAAPFQVLAEQLVRALDPSAGSSTPSLPRLEGRPRQSASEQELAWDRETLAKELYATPSVLALHLQRIAEERGSWVLLFVDQLEELYSLVRDEQVRRRFMEAVCGAADDPHDPVRVVFTLREDFLGRLAEGRLARQSLQHVTVVRDPGPAALEEVIGRPLGLVGYSFDDPALPREMVAAVGQATASLPLLQFACQQLWERRDRAARQLTRRAYEVIGGVQGAFAAYADGVFATLGTKQLAVARELCLRLVTEHGTRRVIPEEEALFGIGPDAQVVLRLLVDARLVTARQLPAGEEVRPHLELAHEWLIETWPTLRRWVEESREDLAFLRDAEGAATLWEKRGRRPAELWSGEALQEARKLLRRAGTTVPERAARFLEAGLARERRRAGLVRLRRIAIVVGLALLAAIFALKERETRRERDRARAEQERAEQQHAASLRESAGSALGRGELLEARAKLRSSLEKQDSEVARMLWWRLRRLPLEWRRSLGNHVATVAYSPDGKRLAAACSDGLVYLCEARTSAIEAVLRGHKDQVRALAFSPDGRRIASGSHDGALWLWETGSRRGRRLEEAHHAPVTAVAFSPNGRLLASASLDRSIALVEVASGRRARLLAIGGPVHALAFHPDGTRLATARGDGGVGILRIPSGEEERVLRGHLGQAWSVRFSPDGKLLASSGADGTVRLWDPSGGRELARLAGHADAVRALSFSPGGDRLASGSMDGQVWLWEVARREGHALATHKDVTGLAFSPDGRFLATTGGVDGSIRVWGVERSPRDLLEVGHTQGAIAISFSPDGKLLASGGYDRSVRIWELASGEQLHLLPQVDAIYALGFSPTGGRLVSAERTVRLYSAQTFRDEGTLGGHPAQVLSLAFSADGKTLATAGYDKTARVWDVVTRLPRRIFEHAAPVYGVAIGPDGTLLATGSTDHTVRLWELDSGRSRRILRGHTGQVVGLGFSPDGSALFSGSDDRTLRRWSLASGEGRVVGRHDGRIYWLDVHPDGTQVGTPSSDGTARIWDLARGSSRVLRGHRGELNSFRFQPGGRLAATAGDDGTVRTWVVETGEPYWRAPLLLPGSPPVLFSHRGWRQLDARPSFVGQGTRWREQVERRTRIAAVTQGRTLLCLGTHDGRLALWEMGRDEPIAEHLVGPIASLLALPTGCLSLSEGRVRLHDPRGPTRELVRAGATSIAVEPSGSILVAAAGQVRFFSAEGEGPLRTFRTEPGVTALARGGEWLVLGHRSGGLELVSAASGVRRARFAFEGTPVSRVTSLLLGEKGIVVAGYEDGSLGIWSLATGTRLESARLHGPLHHLLRQGAMLYAASELGSSLVWDLRVLEESRCALLREVWAEVPVVWEGRAAVLGSPPPKHECLKPQSR